MSALKAIHVGRRALGLDEDIARDIYERATGKRSLRLMSDNEKAKVLQAFEKMGFKKQQGLSGPYAKKLQALWIAGWNLGVVRDRSDKAMLSFIKRQTKIEHTRFLRSAEDGAKAVEALKSWLAREAGVDWSDEEGPQAAVAKAIAVRLLLNGDSVTFSFEESTDGTASAWSQEEQNKNGRKLRQLLRESHY